MGGDLDPFRGGGPVFGRLTDKLGRRRLFVLTLAIYLVGSAIAGLSPDVWFFSVFWSVARLFGTVGRRKMIGGSCALAAIVLFISALLFKADQPSAGTHSAVVHLLLLRLRR